jgi:hypothetical protein
MPAIMDDGPRLFYPGGETPEERGVTMPREQRWGLCPPPARR